jgi:RNA polymerase sigma factor (sigma-70 family)
MDGQRKEQKARFDEWTRDHSAIIHKAVNGFASGDDRNDLLQEVLVAVWKAAKAFRNESKVTSYLYRVCHNAALLWLRTERNYLRRTRQFYPPEELLFIPHEQNEPKRRLTLLYAAIRELSPLERSLVLMSLDGLSYREIAEISGLTESNVGARLSRTRVKLSKTLKTDESQSH